MTLLILHNKRHLVKRYITKPYRPLQSNSQINIKIYLCLVFLQLTSAKILMSNIKMLQFTKHKTHRNHEYIPIRCIGGSGMSKADHIVKKIECFKIKDTNRWNCHSDLPYSYKLAKTIISCKEYPYPQNNYIYNNSCRIEYELHINRESNYIVLVWLCIIVIVFTTNIPNNLPKNRTSSYTRRRKKTYKSNTIAVTTNR